MNARTWYRWHWVTYLLLLVTGGAVAYLQFHSHGWQYGWPFVCIGLSWPYPSSSETIWYPAWILLDVAICFAIVFSTVLCSEHMIRRQFRFNLGSLLLIVAAVAVALSWAAWEQDITFTYPWHGDEIMWGPPGWPNVVSTAWAPLPIRIVIWSAIACTFNIIGWLVMRGSAKWGRLASRVLTTQQ